MELKITASIYVKAGKQICNKPSHFSSFYLCKPQFRGSILINILFVIYIEAFIFKNLINDLLDGGKYNMLAFLCTLFYGADFEPLNNGGHHHENHHQANNNVAKLPGHGRLQLQPVQRPQTQASQQK